MTRIAELRQQMAATHAQIESILAKSRTENRSLNTEEQAAFDKASAEITGQLKTIEAEERAAEAASKLTQQTEERAVSGGDQATATKAAEAWNMFVRAGFTGLNDEQRSLVGKWRSTNTDYRALSIVTNTAGQYTVPTSWETDVVLGMKSYTGILDTGVAKVITTSGGNPINYPTMNDTANVGAILAENTAAGEQDVAFGQVTIGAYKYTTKLIKVPIELLQDSAVDVEGLIREAMSERLGRIWNTHLTVGDGSTQPQGIVTAAALGKTAAAAVAFTSNEMLDLIHSVDPAYRNGARLMFHDTTLKAILQLADSQNRPLFQPSYRDAAPATVHGYPFTINQDMAVPAAAAKFMLFGNFKYFLVRRAMGLDMLRLSERYAESAQVAFVGFARMDSKYIDASGGAVKYMRNA